VIDGPPNDTGNKLAVSVEFNRMIAAAINVNLVSSFALGRSTVSSPMNCTTASPDHGRRSPRNPRRPGLAAEIICRTPGGVRDRVRVTRCRAFSIRDRGSRPALGRQPGDPRARPSSRRRAALEPGHAAARRCRVGFAVPGGTMAIWSGRYRSSQGCP
jgi:hypothetical protein